MFHIKKDFERVTPVSYTHLAFEHQQCDVLFQQMDDCIRPFNYLVMVNRIWLDYNVSANADVNTLDKLRTEQETVIDVYKRQVRRTPRIFASGLYRRLGCPFWPELHHGLGVPAHDLLYPQGAVWRDEG